MLVSGLNTNRKYFLVSFENSIFYLTLEMGVFFTSLFQSAATKIFF